MVHLGRRDTYRRKGIAAVAIAFAAGGAVKAAKTTPLMTVGEGLEALTKVGGADYQPPSG